MFSKEKGYLAQSRRVLVLSCRATVGGFHSDSVFGVDTQISQERELPVSRTLLDLQVLLSQCSTKAFLVL